MQTGGVWMTAWLEHAACQLQEMRSFLGVLACQLQAVGSTSWHIEVVFFYLQIMKHHSSVVAIYLAKTLIPKSIFVIPAVQWCSFWQKQHRKVIFGKLWLVFHKLLMFQNIKLKLIPPKKLLFFCCYTLICFVQLVCFHGTCMQDISIQLFSLILGELGQVQLIYFAIQLKIFCNLVATWLDFILKAYQTLQNDKKKPLAMMQSDCFYYVKKIPAMCRGVSSLSFKKTPSQKLDAVALTDLKTGLGESGSRIGSLSPVKLQTKLRINSLQIARAFQSNIYFNAEHSINHRLTFLEPNAQNYSNNPSLLMLSAQSLFQQIISFFESCFNPQPELIPHHLQSNLNLSPINHQSLFLACPKHIPPAYLINIVIFTSYPLPIAIALLSYPHLSKLGWLHDTHLPRRKKRGLACRGYLVGLRISSVCGCLISFQLTHWSNIMNWTFRLVEIQAEELNQVIKAYSKVCLAAKYLLFGRVVLVLLSFCDWSFQD
ncbi:hypothetical protein VP01_3927g1 [Puccinia sorghi]|uniref:Uncharacterized protein n=1 Tax=Puccinia sorghi TaxID=27349 RepID=A0A0L6UTE2_9BASI|nr:hypothetical protein VP01_3927g1 [Puccinia sorghi]